MAKCRRCSKENILTDKDIEQMVGEITSMKNIRLASAEKYDERFGVCQGCEHFLYGSTCGKCGCVMQVRARLADGRCPAKKWY